MPSRQRKPTSNSFRRFKGEIICPSCQASALQHSPFCCPYCGYVADRPIEPIKDIERSERQELMDKFAGVYDDVPPDDDVIPLEEIAQEEDAEDSSES